DEFHEYFLGEERNEIISTEISDSAKGGEGGVVHLFDTILFENIIASDGCVVVVAGDKTSYLAVLTSRKNI
ncbi:9317_t:CDS:1, partial [Dentiscutata heterogama]